MSAQVVAFTLGKYHMHNSSWSRVDIALHKSQYLWQLHVSAENLQYQEVLMLFG